MTRRQIEQLSFADMLLFGEQQDVRELMKPELRRIDELLDDEALVDEVMVVLRRRRPQSARRGRPATPAVVVLRMLVLKHLQAWSYEQLEWEVGGSLVHRHFCRIGAGRVPDAKTLVRLGQLLTAEVLERLLALTVRQATERKVTRGHKLRKPTEFGAMALIREVEGGIVTGADVVTEHDTALLAGSVEQHIEQFARPPRLAAPDRGFYSKQGEQRIRDELGVRHPVIPKPGYRSAERIEHERRRWFRRGRAWRSGGEARIGRLKNTFGMARSRYRGSDGPQRTARWAAIANNLAAIAVRAPS